LDKYRGPIGNDKPKTLPLKENTMINRFFITLGFLFVATFSGKAQFANAIEYNNYIISTTDSLYKFGQNWGAVLQNCHELVDFSQLWKSRESMEKLIDRKRKEMIELKDIGLNSKPFRMAMVDFLDFEKEMVTKAFVPFEKLTNKNSEQDFQATLGNLNAVALEEGDFLKKLHAAQDEYAAKNGFYINRD
jgi:hypothetical protein